MRFIGKLMVVLGLVAVLPPAGQSLNSQVSGHSSDFAASESSNASTSSPVLDPSDLEAWLDGFLLFALERGRLAGAVVVVVQGGEPVLEKGYGYSDVSARAPVNPQTTLFRPGSISKLFTWTAVMQLVEEGKLDLDEDVNTYLDCKIPPYEGKPITLRNILTHTAGFEESVRYLMSTDPGNVMSLEDYVKLSLPARVFAPGTTPAYSNYATALAGYIVARVSGQSFADYMDQRIFQPLEMEHSTFRQPLPAKLESQMTKGYLTSTEKPKPFEQVFAAPAGSLSASGADMGKFMLAHLADGGPLMKPETARQMHNFKAPGIQSLNTMALGFYEQWINGHRSIGHGGDTPTFGSYLWLFPDDDIGLYISVNSAGTEIDSSTVRTALFQGFADRYLPGDRNFVSIDENTAREHAALMAGRYVNSRGSYTNFVSLFGLLGSVEISVGPEGQLLTPAFDGFSVGARDWVEVAPFLWRDRATGERLAAEVKDGRITRLSIDSVSPFMVFTPAPASANPVWLIPALFAALGLALLAALLWPVRALVRRSFKAEFALSERALLAYRSSRICAWLVLLCVAGWLGLIVTISSDVTSLGGPLDWLIISLRVLTPLATFGLFLTSAWHLRLCFKDSRRWTMKLDAALLALAGLVLIWVTLLYRLYGFGMTY